MLNKKIRIAALGDLHYKESEENEIKKIFIEISKKSDILVLCGDLTDTGKIEQAQSLLDDLGQLNIPIVATLGNHDFENNKQAEIKKMFLKSNIATLDGDIFVFHNIGFVGVKGFMGGFDNHMLASWGEIMVKKFVYQTFGEALKLENALSKLETEHKVVMLHYSPIRQTVIGENPEIIPYCGSSRLEDPINEFNVDLAFHGHAHHGSPEGKTTKGIPIYNVAYPLLKKIYPKKPYVIVEI